MYLQKVISKKKLWEKTYFLFASCKPVKKTAGSGFESESGSGSESGSVMQWYGSADRDPYQNVTDPQNCHSRHHFDNFDGYGKCCTI
jgi:hypothetical protein